MLDKLTGLLLRDWHVRKAASITAWCVFDLMPQPFRSVVVGYMNKEPETAIDRLAMLSPDIREILDTGGLNWIKCVFKDLARLS